VGRTATPIVRSVEVGQPPDAIFGYVTDPTRFAEWQCVVVGLHAPRGEAAGETLFIAAGVRPWRK